MDVNARPENSDTLKFIH